MYNWDKKLAREAMKWGYAPTDLNLYEEVTEAFDDPWKVMSPEDRRLAHKLFIQSMRTMAASPKQKGLIKQLNDLLVKYKLKPIPEEVLDENKSVAQKNLDKSQALASKGNLNHGGMWGMGYRSYLASYMAGSSNEKSRPATPPSAKDQKSIEKFSMGWKQAQDDVKKGTLIEAVAVQSGMMTGAPIRGYSPVQFEERLRTLLVKLGFARDIPIKKVGKSFYLGFMNKPKAEDLAKTLSALLRKNVKAGATFAKVIPIAKNDKAITAGYVPVGSQAAVILNMDSLTEETEFGLELTEEEISHITTNLTESFTMQNLYDLRLLLLALMTDQNVAKIRQQFLTKEKPPAASSTPTPAPAPAPAPKAKKKD